MKKYIFSIVVLVIGLCSCEQIIPITEKGPQALVINALANNDTTLSVSVSYAYSIGELKYLSPWLDTDFTRYIRDVDSAYIRECVCRDANVSLIVNGKSHGNLKYDKTSYAYVSDYKPNIGDEISIVASQGDFETVKASVQVPTPQSVEILNVKKYYSPYTWSEHPTDVDCDTLVDVTLRIKDPGGIRNFYRLKVRELVSFISIVDGKLTAYMSDVYKSSDPIFHDKNLTTGYGGWKAEFSPIFDDTLFDGQSYTFTVTSRKFKDFAGEKPVLSIELQSITMEYYFYMKSCQLYRVSPPSDEGETIHIVSNCSNGFGIFGALGTEKHYINLD